MPQEIFTVGEAARVAGVNEQEIRQAIADGILPAEKSDNIGDYVIKYKDVVSFAKARKQVKLTTEVFVKKKVLIIDDEINFANIMKIELERDIRFEVKVASYGKDGLIQAKDFKPHIILVDFMLPDITGDKIVWQIRTLQKDTKTKIIVYSAHTKEISKGILNLEERMKELGADEFISKTEGMRKIISRVYERLGMDIKTRVIKKQY